jgi:hypothetical protein
LPLSSDSGQIINAKLGLQPNNPAYIRVKPKI